MTKVFGERATPPTEVGGLDKRIYHAWFSPKRRKETLHRDVDITIKGTLAFIAGQRGIDLLECETHSDHVHLLLRLPSGMPLAQAMRYLKGASARYVFQQFPDLKLDLRHDHFWQRGYGFKPIHPGAIASVRTYIRAHRDQPEKEPRTSVRGNIATDKAEVPYP